MAWSFLQARSLGPNGADTSIARAFSSALTAGSLLVAFVYHGDGATCTGVSDPTNGAWTQFPTNSPITGNSRRASAWYFQNNAATTAVTVTAALNASVSARQIIIAEYSGILATGAIDLSKGQTQTNPGTATDAVSSGNTAAGTAAANELAICATFLNSDTPTLTVGTGFNAARTTVTNVGSTCQGALEDSNVLSSGTVVAGTWTTSSTTVDTLTIVGLFKEITAGGAFPAHYYRMMRGY